MSERGNAMINFLKNNTMLKLFSILLAVLMWIYVVQIENPQFEITVQGISVRLLNESQLASRGLMIVEQSSDTMSIRAKGKRQSVIGLKAADVSASIDVGNIQQAGNYSFAPQLTFPDDSISVAEKNPRSITISVDLKGEKNQDITAKVTGTPKEGYYAAEPELYQKEVVIQGPSGLLEQIAKVTAVIDVDGAKKDVKKQVKLQLLKSDGSEIISDKITVSTPVVTVVCKIYPTKKVNLEYEVTGSLNVEDYSLKETVISNPSITVAGSEDVLEHLEYIDLGSFDLGEVTPSNYKKVFPIPLGDSLISVDGIRNVAVEAVLVSDRKKLVEVTGFQLEHLDSKAQASVITQSLQIELEGDKEVLAQVSEDSLTVTLDLEGCVEGVYQIIPEIQCKVEGVTILGDYTVEVLLQ